MSRHKGLSFYKRKKHFSAGLLREILNYFSGIVISVFIAAVVVHSVGVSTCVIGVSMEPSLYNGQKILINRFIYSVTAPKVGDVVVFKPNGNENSHYYIKRVVAVGGDRVCISDGRLLVNGVQADEFGYDKIEDAGIVSSELLLKNGEFFVLGDNRNNSEDSRSANIGPVRSEDIVGKAWLHLSSSENGIGFVK